MILIVTAVFPPEPVVSAILSRDLAETLSSIGQVVVISPKPTRPFGFIFSEIHNIETIYKHNVLESYTNSKSSIFGRIAESYSFGKSTTAYISDYHDVIKVVYVNTWPLLTATITITN